MNKHWMHRALGCLLVSAVSGAGVLAATAGVAHADTAPSISASVSNDANFHITGSGFTPGRSNIAVWLVDFTTNETLYWSGSEQSSFTFCGRWWCSFGGRISVDGPTTYFPADGLFAAHTSANIDLYLHCDHNVRAIAKDGDYSDPGAAWSNVSENIAPACVRIS